MRLKRFSMLFFLLLFPALGCAQKDVANGIMNGTDEQLPEIEKISAAKSKKKYEFVKIEGEFYPIPPPWRGRKITSEVPKLTDLKKIPVEFTYNKSKLYLEEKACDAFTEMAESALEDGVHLLAHSGYRSVRYQRVIFAKLMAQGRTWEDLIRYVAPPGYSEHMLGRAVDLYPSNWRFADTQDYKWLQENGARFGFVETYPENSDAGFPWESWHWSHIGRSKDVSDEDIASQKE